MIKIEMHFMKWSATLILLTLNILICSIISAQQLICGTDQYFSQQLAGDQHLKEKIKRAKQRILSKMGNLPIEFRNTGVIPVVFHVVWNTPEGNISEEKILRQLAILNEVFNNQHSDLEDIPDEFKAVVGHPQLEFCLAAATPQGVPSNGIIRVYTERSDIGNTDDLFLNATGGSSAWDTDHYLNIWISEGLTNTGYAIFPWVANDVKDGIVLSTQELLGIDDPKDSSYRGRVAVHEVGHYLGLSHIWGDDLVFDENCEIDDEIEDTPPQAWFNFKCPSAGEAPPHSCGTNDMYVNFMDYTSDECLSMFTEMQVAFMLATMMEFRPNLLSGNTQCMQNEASAQIDPFEIYPNPTDGIVKIRFTNPVTRLTRIEVYDLHGRLSLEKKQIMYDHIPLDFSELSNGMYFVKINDWIRKLVVNQ